MGALSFCYKAERSSDNSITTHVSPDMSTVLLFLPDDLKNFTIADLEVQSQEDDGASLQ